MPERYYSQRRKKRQERTQKESIPLPQPPTKSEMTSVEEEPHAAMTTQTIKELIYKLEADSYVSIKQHFDALQEEQDRRTDREFDSIRMAVDKANVALERRLDLLNEFRAQAGDEAKKYASTQQLESVRELVDLNTTQVARLYGGLAVVGFIGIANLIKVWFT